MFDRSWNWRPRENRGQPEVEKFGHWVFNGSFRYECLNVPWLLSVQEAQETIEAWRREYNEKRPHNSLAGYTPLEYDRKHLRAESL
jgi:transposase InsO family protein